MELNDEITINAPMDRVYAALNDPEILQQCIPGCEELVKHSDTELEAKVGPCCTNQLRGSFYESSVVAGGYEQLVPYEVQDQELAFVQHGAKAARFAINLV